MKNPPIDLGEAGLARRVSPRTWATEATQWSTVTALRPLHALMVSPSLIFLGTLTIMLFRPPDVQFYSLDRVALLLLVFVVLLRAMALRKSLWVAGPVTWPMLGLLLLGLGGVLSQPYEADNWSLFAAKWVVPFVLYHLAGFVFDDRAALRNFETFALVVLGYLSVIAILFLVDAKSFIFPRYILDESLGIHVDRARGPFLQAVANGVTLNLLGLLALDSFRRRWLRGLWAFLFFLALPLAILATNTRAVWIAFAGSILALLSLSSSLRVRRTCLCMVLAGGMGGLLAMGLGEVSSSLGERVQERGPVEFRMGMYQAGWEMFQEKPLIGWGAKPVQAELAKRISDFHPPVYLFHNTYLEIAVEHGSLGLALYGWMFFDLFRLGRKQARADASPNGSFLDNQFREIWPVMVAVYLMNASFVVMNYQFVNGLLFTIAGMLAAQNRRAHA
ncbi:MAG: O-antigen ligase family protein [Terriglobales bacterium]